MKFDYRKLRGAIVEHCGSQQEFAKKMGWSERTMSLKMNSKRYWKQTEISKACELLKIEDKDICVYFFKRVVQLN